MEKQKTSILQNPWTYVISIAVIGLILFVGLNLTGNAIGSGEYDAFATCLTDAGAVMYGTDWCSHCKAQKEMFGSSFENINFVDCDSNKESCDAAFVTGYPTWVIGGQKYAGRQELSRLASLTGCELVKDDE